MTVYVHAGFLYPLRICAAPWLPWLNITNHKNVNFIDGPFANVLNILASSLNFTYEIVVPPDGQWGVKNDVNNSWSGMVGMVQRQECDLILGPLASSYERSRVLNYTAHVVMAYLSIMGGRMNGGSSVNIFGYFSIFSWQVWVTVFGSMLTMTFVSVFDKAVSNPQKCSFSRVGGHFARELFDYIGTFLMKSSNHLPTSTATRIALGAWWMTVIVLMNTFSGQLKASMFLSGGGDTINSIDDIAREPHIKPYVWKGTAYEAFVKEATNPQFKKVWKRIVKIGGAVVMKDLVSENLLQHVQRRESVIITDIPTIKYAISRSCSKLPDGTFYLGRQTFYGHSLGLAVRKDINPKFLRELNKRIRWLVESELVDRWASMQYGNIERCISVQSVSDTKVLDTRDLLAVFLLWMICIAFSVFVLCIEIIGMWFSNRLKSVEDRKKTHNISKNSRGLSVTLASISGTKGKKSVVGEYNVFRKNASLNILDDIITGEVYRKHYFDAA